ncbi:MAG: MATE family efflux transporter [Merdibacter sp.]
MSEQSVKGLMSEGNIWKQLLFFSIPLVLGNIFQQLYNAVDSIIVGNFVGSQALAAVTSSSPVINMLISFLGLSIGAGVVISRYFGANDRQGVSDSIHTSMAIIILAGIAMTFIGVLLTPYPAMGRRTTGCDE